MDINQESFYTQRQQHWDKVAERLDHWRGWGGYYQKRVAQIYRFNIPPAQKVLEIGCGSGDLLASLQPSYGLGIDISPKMVARAKRLHPEITFQQGDAVHLEVDGQFNYVAISDTINDVWDVQTTFENIARVMAPSGRLVLNFYSRLWELPLKIAAALGLAKPNLIQNWLTYEDTVNLLNLAGFETIRHWVEVLMPLPIPIIAPICNKLLVKFWPFSLLAMTHFMVARLKPQVDVAPECKAGVSIIIPVRNEAGNIAKIFQRVPQMGAGCELVFVEGHSKDNSLAEIKKQIKEHSSIPANVYQQSGQGKGDAIRLGFSKARGDILMILDADLTMPPEYLPRFYQALVSGSGEFINGVRLVYPMEKRAMQFLNFLGNKAFSLIFSYLIGQPVKDTLCGTKVLWKRDYLQIAKNRSYFGDFDPFGDFDLLFGAAKLNLKIIDLPIRYRERTYGETNIQRWKHGWLLLRMVIFAARRLKFI